MEGYNIGIKVDGKRLVGRTQDTMNIAANTKTSITKDDQGNGRLTVTGHTVTLKMAGIVEVMEDGTTNVLTNAEIMELALKKGKDAVIPVTYDRGTDAPYGGNGVITGYSEDSSAEGDATYGLDIQISGEFAKQLS